MNNTLQRELWLTLTNLCASQGTDRFALTAAQPGAVASAKPASERVTEPCADHRPLNAADLWAHDDANLAAFNCSEHPS
jgi:hypothetical protein